MLCDAGTDTSGLVGNNAITAIGATAAVVLEQAIIRGVRVANKELKKFDAPYGKKLLYWSEISNHDGASLLKKT